MYRRFLATLLGLMGLAVLTVLGTGLWLERLSGDLTRLGGYAENSFGWTGNETIYSPPLAQRKARADIVVLGDSFSLRVASDQQTPEGAFWTDHLAALTGRSVSAFPLATMPVERLVALPWFRADPPALVILELVERSLHDRLAGGDASCLAATGATPPDLTISPLPLPAQ